MKPSRNKHPLQTPSKISGETLSEELQALPLIIDMDGTLLRVDMLFEKIIWFLRTYPLKCFMLVLWALKGRVVLKRRLADIATLNTNLLPVNTEFATFLAAQAEEGRAIHLATAADEISAHKIARRFPFIQRVFASDGITNLKGNTKAQTLNKAFPNGYIYAGDSAVDLDIFHHARATIVVSASKSVERRAQKIGNVELVFSKEPVTLKFIAKVLRLHQWVKNALIFIPLVLGGLIGDLNAWAICMVGFVAMGLMASSTYLLNDLLDISEDRQHWSKCERPLASGKLQIKTAFMLIPAGLVASLALMAFANVASLGVLCLYLILTVLYSLILKKEPIVDVVALAGLFTLRLAFGVTLSGVVLSEWLLVFSMFLFLSLSLAKRHVEVARLIEHGKEKAAGRGYSAKDGPILMGLGAASCIAAVFLLVMYLINDAFNNEFYSLPALLWCLPVVMFIWLGRMWLACQRNEIDDDPIVYVLKDHTSLAMGALMGVIFMASWLGGLAGL